MVSLSLSVMTVNPGWGGQSAIPSSIAKAAEREAKREARGLDVLIEVDGGVGPANAYKVIEAGANAIVAGSAVFKADDYAEAIAGIKNSTNPANITA